MKTRMKIVLAAVLVSGAVTAYMVCLQPVWLGTQAVRFALWRQGVHSEWTTVDGQWAHYFEVTPKTEVQAVPVILVHGLGGRAEDWVNYLPALKAQGYHVYAPDLLGYGRSARPAEASYSIAEEEEFLRGFMADRGIAQADIVGWSMGGWVTLKLALDRPQMVRRVVAIDAAGVYFHPPMSLSLFAPQSEEQVQELYHYLEPGDRRLPHLVARDALTGMERNSWVVERSAIAMMDGNDLLDFRLGGLKQPTLLVWGAGDRLTPAVTGRRMHALIRQSQYVELPGCGHLVPIECGKQSLAPVEEFLSAGNRE